MEVIEILADGDNGVRLFGVSGYFNWFYDFVPHRDQGGMHENSVLSEEERALLLELSTIVDDACDATPYMVSEDDLIASGWPKRIQPVAQKALDLMRKRGQFSEELEEDTPSA